MAVSPGFVHRIAAGSADGPNSATLRVWSDKGSSDVYAAIRELAGDLKVSLHESGQCQSGLTSQSAQRNAAAIPQIGGSRLPHIWTRHTKLGSQSAVALHVCFPGSELRVWRKSPPEQNITWLPAPALGRTVSVHLVYSGSLRKDDDWPGRLLGVQFHASHVLANGEKLWVLWEAHDTTLMELRILKATRSMPDSKLVPLDLSSAAKSVGNRITGFGLDPGASFAFVVDAAHDSDAAL